MSRMSELAIVVEESQRNLREAAEYLALAATGLDTGDLDDITDAGYYLDGVARIARQVARDLRAAIAPAIPLDIPPSTDRSDAYVTLPE